MLSNCFSCYPSSHRTYPPRKTKILPSTFIPRLYHLHLFVPFAYIITSYAGISCAYLIYYNSLNHSFFLLNFSSFLLVSSCQILLRFSFNTIVHIVLPISILTNQYNGIQTTLPPTLHTGTGQTFGCSYNCRRSPCISRHSHYSIA